MNGNKHKCQSQLCTVPGSVHASVLLFAVFQHAHLLPAGHRKISEIHQQPTENAAPDSEWYCSYSMNAMRIVIVTQDSHSITIALLTSIMMMDIDVSKGNVPFFMRFKRVSASRNVICAACP